MERYINSFATENDIQIALQNGELLKPYVAYIEDEKRIDWNSKTKIVDYTTEYLTFNILSAGTINWTVLGSSAKTIEYKLNDDNWVSITSNTEGAKITVNSGDKVQFRGNNAQYCDGNSSYNMFSGSTAEFEVEGNIMSLINSENFATLTTLESDYTFSYLFYNCKGLTSAENLILPATTLTNSCYSYMFQGCTSLTTAPALPATTLAYSCYQFMFQGCTSLTAAPALPAIDLASSCYKYMFDGCTSLTTAPALPATALDYGCYNGMFQGCTKLTTAPALPATTLTNSCYSYMFAGCTSLATAPELPATTIEAYCYRQMFDGCTSLTTAPALPATTLEGSCYTMMFRNCVKLNYIKCLATNISETNCTLDWVNGVAATGTFVKNPNMASWTTGKDGIPTGWTVQDA